MICFSSSCQCADCTGMLMASMPFSLQHMYGSPFVYEFTTTLLPHGLLTLPLPKPSPLSSLQIPPYIRVQAASSYIYQTCLFHHDEITHVFVRLFDACSSNVFGDCPFKLPTPIFFSRTNVTVPCILSSRACRH